MNSNTDRDQRVEQLEAAVFPDTGRRVPAIGERFTVIDITPNVLDFHDGRCTVVTLSLLDSQAVSCTLPDDDELVAEMNTEAENLVGEWYRESQHRDDLVDEIVVTLTATHRRAEANAATRMRDACIARVRAMIDNWDREARTAKPEANHRTYINYSDAAWEIITALSSLTLDQVEQEKR